MHYDILIVEDSHERMIHLKKFVIGFSYRWAETAPEGIHQLQNNTFKYVMLDHDLAQEHYTHDYEDIRDEYLSHRLSGTGQDVADWLARNKTDSIEAIFIHSLNPVGTQNMYLTLRNVYPTVKASGCWSLYQDFTDLIIKSPIDFR